ncbi:hypothetical protein [Dyella jiangningensis]|uniref:Uncharacterized protein n=1 Tax=Dyella jiangningensis TaxID=1379159 RepID=A0A328P5B9_9GAMM|nr:hypothetical protein [Dyella jiangningensis]RAO76216.1 hypothetical protein CA260_10995 [Dyella jiangningensis]
MRYEPDGVDIGISIDIGRTPRPGEPRKGERGKRAPRPGIEPCIEPEYLDLPIPLRDPAALDPRVQVWC